MQKWKNLRTFFLKLYWKVAFDRNGFFIFFFQNCFETVKTSYFWYRRIIQKKFFSKTIINFLSIIEFFENFQRSWIFFNCEKKCLKKRNKPVLPAERALSQWFRASERRRNGWQRHQNRHQCCRHSAESRTRFDRLHSPENRRKYR